MGQEQLLLGALVKGEYSLDLLFLYLNTVILLLFYLKLPLGYFQWLARSAEKTDQTA